MSKNIQLPYDTCFGCGGCFNVCPKGAITMTPDDYGYVHPSIDPDKCIECHLCEKVCTVYHPQQLHEPEEVLAAVTRDEDELKSVASGGLCTCLGREIINRGGVVYGCREKDFRTIRHVRVDNEKDLDLLKKSKYVHSDMGDAFKLIKADLDAGLSVLFVGTPCQVSGLYGYLRKPYEHLYTVDMVCHGVPSQKMLREQIEYYRKPGVDDFDSGFVQFRWKDPRYGIRFGIRFGINGKEIACEPEWRNPYMAAFNRGISYRENCFTCPFARSERVSDITAADFWGVGKKVESEFMDTDGVSMVFINTPKGQNLFESIKDLFRIESHTMEEAKRCNANLSHPAPRLDKRDEFLRLFKEKGIKEAAYVCLPKYRKMRNPLYRFLVNNRITASLYRVVKGVLKRKNSK